MKPPRGTIQWNSDPDPNPNPNPKMSHDYMYSAAVFIDLQRRTNQNYTSLTNF